MNSITQDMKYRQSLMIYAKKYGVSRASRKYNRTVLHLFLACTLRRVPAIPCLPVPPPSQPP